MVEKGCAGKMINERPGKKMSEIVVPISLRMEFNPESRELMARASQATEDIGEAMFIISDALGRIACGDEAKEQACSCQAEAESEDRTSTPAACPFCGSTMVEATQSISGIGHCVRCTVCCATGPRCMSEKGAVAFWNHREGGLGNA